MIEDPKVKHLARVLALAYGIGHLRLGEIPKTVVELWKHGHDGLNWRLFVPLAEEIVAMVRDDASSQSLL